MRFFALVVWLLVLAKSQGWGQVVAAFFSAVLIFAEANGMPEWPPFGRKP